MQLWLDRYIPEGLRIEYRKPCTVVLWYDHGWVMLSKVYVATSKHRKPNIVVFWYNHTDVREARLRKWREYHRVRREKRKRQTRFVRTKAELWQTVSLISSWVYFSHIHYSFSHLNGFHNHTFWQTSLVCSYWRLLCCRLL